MAGGEMDIGDAAAREPFQLPGEERAAGDRHEDFRAVGIERAQARAFASAENDGLHGDDSVVASSAQPAAAQSRRVASISSAMRPAGR